MYNVYTTVLPRLARTVGAAGRRWTVAVVAREAAEAQVAVLLGG